MVGTIVFVELFDAPLHPDNKNINAKLVDITKFLILDIMSIQFAVYCLL